MTPTKTLAKKAGILLRQARRKTGLTADRLIEKSGDKSLTKSLVSRYESGAVVICLERLRLLLKVCGEEVPGEVADEYRDLAEREPHMAQVGDRDLWREFVSVWQTSATIKEAAGRLGMSVGNIYYKAKRARAKGVPLKPMARVKHVDWDSLAELARSLNGKKE